MLQPGLLMWLCCLSRLSDRLGPCFACLGHHASDQCSGQEANRRNACSALRVMVQVQLCHINAVSCGVESSVALAKAHCIELHCTGNMMVS